jgi:hypothetical protein
MFDSFGNSSTTTSSSTIVVVEYTFEDFHFKTSSNEGEISDIATLPMTSEARPPSIKGERNSSLVSLVVSFDVDASRSVPLSKPSSLERATTRSRSQSLEFVSE